MGCTALICGIICNQFTVWNMSFEAREYARAFYVVLSEISDHLLMMWVGLLYYFSLEHFNVQFSLVALGLVVSSRALSVFSCGAYDLRAIYACMHACMQHGVMPLDLTLRDIMGAHLCI